MEYELNLTSQELQLVGNALGAQPYSAVVVLLAKIQQQVSEQEAKAKVDVAE